MDSADLQSVSSMRRNSSSIWRNATTNVFSRSHHEEDDEEALKWAALEKLPTYDRLRKGILTVAPGDLREVDIQSLGTQERKILMDRLIKVAEEDNEKFLLKLRNRIDQVGIELPTIEVRFEHLNIDAEAYIGSRALPTFLNFITNIVEGFLNCIHILPSRKRPLSILHDVSGIIKPSRLTLLLGPPGAGKTTLLLALAGKLDPDLKAAALPGEEASVVTDYIIKILGLEVCADTLVGDEMLRGISGGQRKRVTTGEMLVGPARALFMDEISTGLDSSTTFQIMNALRQSIHILNLTAIISLLQPAPETYDLFDDVILLSEGQIVYQGPRENVLEFFESMGFKCPERKGVADFLQEVTSRKDQQQYWVKQDEPYSYIPVKAFAEAFRSFHVGKRLGDELAIPFDKNKSHPAALTTSRFGASKKELLKACTSREYLLMKRNSFVFIFRISQLIFISIITMTIFLRSKMHRDTVNDGGIFMGALFFTLFVSMFNGFAELAMAVHKLPVFYKQRDLLFFPAWAYSLPIWILRIPISIVEVAIYVSLTYYVIGFDPNAERFFKQCLILLATSQMASGLFRVVAACGRSMIVANTSGSYTLLLVAALGGFLLSRDNVKKWWKWGYWVSPLMYAQNAISVNEFLGKSWNHFRPGSTVPLGVEVLTSRRIFVHAYWYWLGVGAMVGYVLLFNAICPLALHYLNPYGRAQTVLSEEALREKHANRTGEFMGPTTGRESSVDHIRPESRRNETRNNTLSEGSFSSQAEAISSASQNTKKGMVLPFTPLSITFDNIQYSVDMPEEMKSQGFPEDQLELLKGVSGAFRPGVLTALMGVSGAGKTTLMDVLAGRKTSGYIEGNITISGYPKKQETFARISGYCEQNDIHSPHVTVHESLTYSAWLRLPTEVDSATRMMFIEEVMELVELTSLKGSLVGLPGINGLSTEQRKRMTIAVELVANPSIIFMDEPTSGLDARAAAIVMRTVRNTVDTGRTVVCTIHQPSIDIFEAFDELLLLKRGGEEIYVGPLGHNSFHLIKYFEGIDGINKIKDGYNPATWMLDVTSSVQEEALGVNFAEIYKNSELYRRNKALIKELSKPPSGSRDLHFPTKYSQPFFTQCMACLWKQHWSYWRNTQYTAVRFWFAIFVGLSFGSIFWDLGSKTKRQVDLLNSMASMYSAGLFLGVQNASSAQPVVAVERTVFYRERAAGMYSALPYAFGQVTVELPYVLLQAVVYGTIVYAMTGYEWKATKFFWYLFFMYFTLLTFTYFGMMTVGITPNHNIAAIISVTFYMIWNIFTGFLIPRTRIPIWWRWNYWLDPIAWTLYGLVVSQYGSVDDVLDTGETIKAFVRSYFGFKRDFLGAVAAMHIIFSVVFALIFAISIRTFNFQKR
ncbi:pleiotropic drug resistance protein 1-like isoform X2 [Magnolia sinica]|uniref:pleiotropic drug resistance protein 1-like isoform X2 n=1 Tax=Magnolia sinica TaxID=86752 RepID=UPI002659467E|nr:pleiotropic drug resistance protein 1-like isoform X2 [Magnolia sinica]